MHQFFTAPITETTLMRHLPIAFITLLATPTALPAADLAAVLANHLVTVAKPDGKTVTIQLKPDGVAVAQGAGGKQRYGKWLLQQDQLCVDVPPRKQVCLSPVAELADKGNALMTTPNGEKLQVNMR